MNKTSSRTEERRHVGITAPALNASETEALALAGATEIYTGWTELPGKTGVWAELNRQSSYISNSADALQFIKEAHRQNLKVFITFNTAYGAENFREIYVQTQKACEYGANGLIISDPAMLRTVSGISPGIKLIASVLSVASNSYSIDFFRCLGARRIIMPTHLSLEEISAAISNSSEPDTEYEAIVMNYGCHYEDGLCGFGHTGPEITFLPRFMKKPAFRQLYRSMTIGCISKLPVHLRRSLLKYAVRINPCCIMPDEARPTSPGLYHHLSSERFFYRCALCDIGPLIDAGITCFKTVGRDLPLRQRCLDIKAVVTMVNAWQRGLRGPEYRRMARRIFRSSRGFECRSQYCFYHACEKPRQELTGQLSF